MQGRWTIGKKLFTGVGVLIALLMASGATTLWTTRAMNERLVHTGEKTVRRSGSPSGPRPSRCACTSPNR